MSRRATYRLQLSPDFGLGDATAVVPYLRALGVSHVYLSPVFEAVPGSSHGYDVTDPTRIREELGGEAALRGLAGAARAAGLELILDIVPNHMAATEHNPWWWDVMRRGRESGYADFFDIDWARGGGRLVLPVLESPLAEALAAGALAVERGSPHDPAEPVLTIGGGRRLPLREPGGPLESALLRQPYRLVPWREAGKRVNYRRFFDINDLVGLRVEDERVFDATHGLVSRLVAEGVVGGLRVDHVDGLRAPGEYLRRLRRLGPDAWILVEKILGHDERLPAWPVDGTTGYEFLRAVDALWVDPDGFRRLEADALAAGAAPDRFETVSRNARREVLLEQFSGDLDRLAKLAASAVKPPAAGGAALREAIVELTAGLDVYRTYLGDPAAPESPARLRRALAAAAGRADGAALKAVAAALEGGGHPELRARWEQLSGAVMAKGLEDTALYRHVAMLGLNEVGGEPAAPPDAAGAFIRFLEGRTEGTLSATATHDTKLGEDTRARLAVLGELGDQWLAIVQRWRHRHAPLRAEQGGRPVPGPADELRFYQALLGIWPAGDEDPAGLLERLTGYLVKASREAGRRTSWLDTDAGYEAALATFARRLLAGPEGGPFREEARALRDRLAVHGCVNSLARTALKLAAPGVPDLYRGTEVWDLTLVDPDNRRPLDFTALAAALATVEEACLPALVESLAAGRPDGRLKTWVTRRMLALRATRPGLFGGAARLLPATGEHAGRVLAMARSGGDGTLIVVVPRLAAGLSAGPPLGREVWGDTCVPLPEAASAGCRDCLAGARAGAVADGAVQVGAALGKLPVAVLATGGRDA